MESKTWLTYWKKSLADSLAADIDIEKFKYFEIENFEIDMPQLIQTNLINQLVDFEEERVNKKKGISKKDSESWIRLESVQILISPFKLVQAPEHMVYVNDRKPKFPFWYSARINRSGVLSVPEEVFPIFQRKYLEPLADERTEFIFSTVEKVDQAAGLGNEEYKDYNEYLKYLKAVFNKVVDQHLDKYKAEGYLCVRNAIILLPDEDINAAFGIIQLYEKILQKKNIPPLLASLIQLNNEVKRLPDSVRSFIESNALHLGQMGFDFPLSISQRKALYTFLRSHDRVFTVNGPPGTGKTTLLQSIVANMVVESAIDGVKPPLILACSTNNQAVTNIIDSFSRANTKVGGLQGRWLPDINGYATYLPAGSKTVTELAGINYKKLSGEGIFSKIEEQSFLNKAKGYFEAKGNKYFSSKTLLIPDILLRLQNEIKAIQSSILTASEKWQEYLTMEEAFEVSYYHESQERVKYYNGSFLNEESFELDIADLNSLEQSIINHFRNESFFRKLFCFLRVKSALKNRASELKTILRNSHIPVTDDFVFTQYDILDKIDKKINLAKRIIKVIKEWTNWKQQNHIRGDPPGDEAKYWEKEYVKIEASRNKDHELSQPNCFYDELDVTLRHSAFQLAMHYWEGRWLLKLEEDLFSDFFLGKNEEKTLNRWLRQAMVTPCFVSTFYMAPKFFNSSRFLQYSDSGNPIFDHPPLYEFIDLLIVDEAAQVSPEVGVATFSLAKRAIVVGDIKQIEPVWNITHKIDVGNLRRSGLIKNYDDLIYEKEFDPKGFLASTGSIMKMAQNACYYKETVLKEKGVLLVEHRRCYDEIINYCNVLAYNGLLKPLKGKSKNDNLYPAMCCIHVDGNSDIIGASRYNLKEVNTIVNWLVKNRQKIENKYERLENSVGIITPFTGQKNSLRYELNKAGFDTNLMKLGTVHALQGAERPIVILSMVYGPGEVGTMFFDRDNKPNILNVAVSRAKDCFIVFANTNILNRMATTPSGILANHLIYI